jgi:hypothetical protein
LLVLRTSTGPFSEVEGLFTVLMCTRCRAVRHASPPALLAHHDRVAAVMAHDRAAVLAADRRPSIYR